MVTEVRGFSFSASPLFPSTPAATSTADNGSFKLGADPDNNPKSPIRRTNKIIKRRKPQLSSVQSSVHTSNPSLLYNAVEVKQNKTAVEEKKAEPIITVTDSPLPLTRVTRIFNGIPQNPHFYQLSNFSKSTRNNLISAWDRIFEETVKEIHSLEPLNFCVRAKELWKTMEELQNVGYNVIFLRRRLVELSDVMEELRVTKNEIKGLKIKAENHRMEKSRLEYVIKILKSMIREEEGCMERVLTEVAKLENDLPKFDYAFVNLALKSF